ncbi:sigma-70 family RNA polymerase sigma factor [Lentisphaera profundi]|uniref:Sigma-70 family RNA polymerase sigma factor n=1 Tax=Lentisphaera profundi TaxID=1658616 RepID=A0ABY7VZI7_9BACT|nr:sigma-70 family RNA polymerase sigma factor [Lentisphaera profundi]WDE98620.1 sigma-70 family RNA polymerase sigma factor [Lentisphaera profundi]
MSDIQHTRESLLLRLQNKRDQFSWKEFCEAYERYIYLVIRGMKMDHHDAEDLTQNVLIKVYENIAAYDYSPEHSRFRTWLSKICRNQVIDYVRKMNAESKRVENYYQKAAQMTQPQVDALAESEWKAHVTTSAWDNIQNKFRGNATSCFEKINGGQKVAEVAQELGLSESSVYVYFKRVKDHLIAEVRRLENAWG